MMTKKNASRELIVNEPANAGGILVAPGVSPGLYATLDIKPALAGDRMVQNRLR